MQEAHRNCTDLHAGRNCPDQGVETRNSESLDVRKSAVPDMLGSDHRNHVGADWGKHLLMNQYANYMDLFAQRRDSVDLCQGVTAHIEVAVGEILEDSRYAGLDYGRVGYVVLGRREDSAG